VLAIASAYCDGSRVATLSRSIDCCQGLPVQSRRRSMLMQIETRQSYLMLAAVLAASDLTEIDQ